MSLRRNRQSSDIVLQPLPGTYSRRSSKNHPKVNTCSLFTKNSLILYIILKLSRNCYSRKTLTFYIILHSIYSFSKTLPKAIYPLANHAPGPTSTHQYPVPTSTQYPPVPTSTHQYPVPTRTHNRPPSNCATKAKVG